MRYRRLTTTGDYSFGFGQADFYINSPEAVAQLVLTRLRLDLGAWFLDDSDGTNWKTGVLGNNTASTRDAIIQSRILGTTGVNSILSYSSSFNGNIRSFSVAVSLDTIYGTYPSPSSASSSTTSSSSVGVFTLDSPTAGVLDVDILD
jgi:hypothetical protein